MEKLEGKNGAIMEILERVYLSDGLLWDARIARYKGEYYWWPKEECHES